MSLMPPPPLDPTSTSFFENLITTKLVPFLITTYEYCTSNSAQVNLQRGIGEFLIIYTANLLTCDRKYTANCILNVLVDEVRGDAFTQEDLVVTLSRASVRRIFTEFERRIEDDGWIPGGLNGVLVPAPPAFSSMVMGGNGMLSPPPPPIPPMMSPYDCPSSWMQGESLQAAVQQSQMMMQQAQMNTTMTMQLMQQQLVPSEAASSQCPYIQQQQQQQQQQETSYPVATHHHHQQQQETSYPVAPRYWAPSVQVENLFGNPILPNPNPFIMSCPFASSTRMATNSITPPSSSSFVNTTDHHYFTHDEETSSNNRTSSSMATREASESAASGITDGPPNNNSSSNSNKSHQQQQDCCSVCLENERTHAFVPCGHFCICAPCAVRHQCNNTNNEQQHHQGQLLLICPLCRAPSTSLMRIYA